MIPREEKIMPEKLDESAVGRAAKILAEATRSRTLINRLPVDIRPVNSEDGKAIAEAALDLIDKEVVGWKIGYASIAERRDMENVPVPGRLLQGSILQSPANIHLSELNHPLIEAEIALVLGSDMPARDTLYTPEEAKEAVSSAHVAIEIADPRYKDFNEPENAEFIADNACSRFVVVGPEVPNWKDGPLSDIEVTMLFDDELVSKGRKDDDRCDGFWSLAWLINDVGKRGYSLKAGQVFSSGAVAKVLPLGNSRRVVVNFNGVEAALSIGD
jgi:2-keto-4-pentenoate hydratase|tara:strand:- start:6058 stop:6873 length:816 start_codon:yes stop_codon:yes gene_type:complete